MFGFELIQNFVFFIDVPLSLELLLTEMRILPKFDILETIAIFQLFLAHLQRIFAEVIDSMSLIITFIVQKASQMVLTKCLKIIGQMALLKTDNIPFLVTFVKVIKLLDDVSYD